MRFVLVVEENEIVRGLIREIVRTQEFEPVEASNGEDGFRIAQRSKIDAIILDCLGRSGQEFETLMKLRADARTGNIPVIAMCGLGQYSF